MDLKFPLTEIGLHYSTVHELFLWNMRFLVYEC